MSKSSHTTTLYQMWWRAASRILSPCFVNLKITLTRVLLLLHIFGDLGLVFNGTHSWKTWTETFI
jgi:hypothetical protein